MTRNLNELKKGDRFSLEKDGSTRYFEFLDQFSQYVIAFDLSSPTEADENGMVSYERRFLSGLTQVQPV